MSPRCTDGTSTTSSNSVANAFSPCANVRSRRYDTASSTSAVEALSSMITGASTSTAIAIATPYAASPSVGSGSRATTAARYGPSTAIITHVAASGAQNAKIPRAERSFVAGARARRVNPRTGPRAGPGTRSNPVGDPPPTPRSAIPRV